MLLLHLPYIASNTTSSDNKIGRCISSQIITVFLKLAPTDTPPYQRDHWSVYLRDELTLQCARAQAQPHHTKMKKETRDIK